jgi:hypothetical protein
MTAKDTLRLLDDALFGDESSVFGQFGQRLDSGKPPLSNDNPLIHNAIGQFGQFGQLERVGLGLEHDTERDGSTGETEGKKFSARDPLFLLSKLSKLSKAAPSKGFPLDSDCPTLSNAVQTVQKSGGKSALGLIIEDGTLPEVGNDDDGQGLDSPELAVLGVLDAVQTVQSEKGDGYQPFDWGPADRRFERFRRCPDLLRSTGDTP